MLVIKPFNVVLFLTIFIPLQEPFFNWLPVPDSIYIWLRLVTEIIIYLLLVLVIINKMVNNKPLKKTPIDLLVIAFVGLSIFSMISKSSLTIDGINNLRSLIRYLAIYYLVVNLSISRKQFSILLLVILIIGVFEGILTAGQFLSDDFNKLFLLKNVQADIGGIGTNFPKAKVGAVYGTFGSETEMALFSLIAIIIAFVFGYRKAGKIIPEPKFLIIILVIIWGIFASFKRAALLSIPILLSAVLFFSRKTRQLSLFIFVSIGLITSIVFIIFWGAWNFNFSREYQGINYRRVESFSLGDYFSNPFTTGYWEHLVESQRIRFALDVSGTMLREINLIGYGPDQQNARETLAEIDPLRFVHFTRPQYGGFEDVYWVAMLVYYGIIGLSIFLMALFLLFRTSVLLTKFSDNNEIRLLGIVFNSVLVLTLIFTFVYRTFEFRAYGYNFWLLAGLVVNAYNQIINQNHKQHELEGAII